MVSLQTESVVDWQIYAENLQDAIVLRQLRLHLKVLLWPLGETVNYWPIMSLQRMVETERTAAIRLTSILGQVQIRRKHLSVPGFTRVTG